MRGVQAPAVQRLWLHYRCKHWFSGERSETQHRGKVAGSRVQMVVRFNGASICWPKAVSGIATVLVRPEKQIVRR